MGEAVRESEARLAAGRPAAFLGVQPSQPRAWTDFELLLTEETAERAWAAVERARAEAAAAVGGELTLAGGEDGGTLARLRLRP